MRREPSCTPLAQLAVESDRDQPTGLGATLQRTPRSGPGQAHANVASDGLAARRVRALANASTTPRARPRPTSTTSEPASSPQVGRSLRTSQAVMIPITGTSSVKGATVDAG